MTKVTFANKVEPLRRNIQFKLASKGVDKWNGAGVQQTQFMNALSIFFPAGERFFIDSIRNYRDQITNEQLKKDVKEFIGQEAMHTREHLVYNQALIDAGFPVQKYMDQIEQGLEQLKKHAPKRLQLAITMALEHVTASLGEVLLENPELMADSDENYRNVWNWHAMEEIEHKGVAFDVWNEVTEENALNYGVRVGAFVGVQVIFWTLVAAYHISLVHSSGKLFNLSGWLTCVNYLWGKPGALRKIAPEMFKYLTPGFHPWQNDNRHLIADVEKLAKHAEHLYQQQAGSVAAA